MPIKSVCSGSSFEVCCWKGGDSDNGPLEDFFAKLSESGNQDLKQMLRLMNRSAESGPPRNEEMTKMLDDGIFEFKADSIRVLWFYYKGKIICTHGFLKKSQKTPKREIERAKKTRRAYSDEQQPQQDREKQPLRDHVRRDGKR
ncbi:MAG TPA: type II toxin-antitoxin system RelE/ParE family toxin [Candidatus Rifleibacterium sp.]|nr:type II toxin-antitoxin system RelE/ParE family toxin [Candidatus Rifleibacterium sp.]